MKSPIFLDGSNYGMCPNGHNSVELSKCSFTCMFQLIYDESTASDVSDILDDMDDYLDDAFPDGSPGPTPPKRKSTSPVSVCYLFHIKKTRKN